MEGLREAAEFFGSLLPLEQLHRLISLRVVGVELETELGGALREVVFSITDCSQEQEGQR